MNIFVHVFCRLKFCRFVVTPLFNITLAGLGGKYMVTNISSMLTSTSSWQEATIRVLANHKGDKPGSFLHVRIIKYALSALHIGNAL